MGQKKVNEFICEDLTVNSNISFGLSTSSTSFDFVASIDLLTTASTQLNFSKRTAYLESGIIRSLTTAASTFVLST